MEIEIYWHPRTDRSGRAYALTVHNEYSLGPEFHTSSQTNTYGAGGLDAGPVSIFDLIAMAVDGVRAAQALMLAASTGRLMPAQAGLH